jgi:hypothetical protein
LKQIRQEFIDALPLEVINAITEARRSGKAFDDLDPAILEKCRKVEAEFKARYAYLA